jgi:hypothetical protein
MQLDHRPGETKITPIGNFIWRTDEEGFQNEVSKCDVICGNCHAIRTGKRGQRASALQRKNLSIAMKRVQNRPDVREKKSTSQSIAMKAFHAQRKAAGIPWHGSRKKP